MPLLEIVQTTHVNATVRLEESTAIQVDQYAAFLHAPADQIVDKALAFVFAKDREFQEFLRTSEAPTFHRVSASAASVRAVPLPNQPTAPPSAPMEPQ